MSRYTKAEQEEAKTSLRAFLPQGATVYLVSQSVSRSGMSRTIKCLAVDEKGRPFDISWHVGHALGMTVTEGPARGVRISGCGMDMGLALINRLSSILYNLPLNAHKAHNATKTDAEEKAYDLTHGLRYGWL